MPTTRDKTQTTERILRTNTKNEQRSLTAPSAHTRALHLGGLASRGRRSGPGSSQCPLESVKCGVDDVAPPRIGAPAAAAPTKSLGRSVAPIKIGNGMQGSSP
jgi:hypothetical protein